MYNWYAVAGIHNAASATNPALRKKLAPSGWHVSSDIEWVQLSNCLGGETGAGGKMKATGTIQTNTGLWQSPNIGASNNSEFTGLPGGYRRGGGSFIYIGEYGAWWSTTQATETSYWLLFLSYNNSNASITNEDKILGFSVRCLKD